MIVAYILHTYKQSVIYALDIPIFTITCIFSRSEYIFRPGYQGFLRRNGNW